MIFDYLPEGMITKNKWKGIHKRCTMDSFWSSPNEVPCTRDVYRLRKMLHGLTIGPLDKNNGECWCCCPVTYQKAMEKTYCPDTGYELMNPYKATPYKIKKWKEDALTEVWTEGCPPRNQQGGARDVVKIWERHYKKMGWNKFASFRKDGGFNKPYILFKTKNVADSKIRDEKIYKTRPIAPTTKHPMRTLLRRVGRAWAFVAANMEGEHFTLNKCTDVPEFLRETEKKLGELGEIEYIIRDIEGCFPNMPKEAIRLALREEASKRIRMGLNGVYVPKFAMKKIPANGNTEVQQEN